MTHCYKRGHSELNISFCIFERISGGHIGHCMFRCVAGLVVHIIRRSFLYSFKSLFLITPF